MQHPELANETFLGLVLDQVGEQFARGRDDLAQRLSEAADATLEYLPCPSCLEALQLAEWWVRLGEVERAEQLYMRLLTSRNRTDGNIPPTAVSEALGWLLLASGKPEAAGRALDHLPVKISGGSASSIAIML